MGIFKPARIDRKQVIGSLLGGILFAIPMTFILTENEPALSMVLNTLLFFLLSLGNGYLNDSINISWIEYPVKRFIYTLFFSIVYTLLVAVFVVAVVAYGFYGHPPGQSLRNMDTGYYISVLGITLFFSLFFFGRGFLLNWRQSELRAAKLREAHIAAQYESLQNQVNPHFLFNSLNVLSTLVYRDPDLAAKFIKQLSVAYRYVLDAKNKEVVPLATELAALEAYIFLVRIRFGEGIVFDNRLPDGLDGYIAPLSLQMLVENAVKHNVAGQDTPLSISLFEEEGYIVVRNKLQKKHSAQEAMGIGLANIKTRYQYLSGRPVEVEENTSHFTVKLPLIEIEEKAAPEPTLSKNQPGL